MAKKKITEALKEAVGIKEVIETNSETLIQLCWDAVNSKCIAFDNVKGKLVRYHPPSLTPEQIKSAEKTGWPKIVAFK